MRWVVVIALASLLAVSDEARGEAIAVAIDGDARTTGDLAGSLRGGIEQTVGPVEPGESARTDHGPRVLRAGSEPARWVLVEVSEVSRRAVRYVVSVRRPDGIFRRGGLATPADVGPRAIADALMGLLVPRRSVAPRRIAVIGAADEALRDSVSALRGRGLELVPAGELRAALAEVKGGRASASHLASVRELLVADAVISLDRIGRGRDRTILTATVHDGGPVRGTAVITTPQEASQALTELLLQVPLAREVAP